MPLKTSVFDYLRNRVGSRGVLVLTLWACGGPAGSTSTPSPDADGVFQGDILLEATQTPADSQATLQPKAVGLANLSRGDSEGEEWGGLYAARLWRSGVIPYRFSQHLSPNQRAWIGRAIAHYHERTSIRWVELKGPSLFTNHVVFSNDIVLTGALSFVGDWRGGYEQGLWFGGKVPDEVVPTELVKSEHQASFQTMIHEMGHAVGLWHEMQHTDRERWDGTWFAVPNSSGDDARTVWWPGSELAQQLNYAIPESGHSLGEVNWESVMWYDEDEIFAQPVTSSGDTKPYITGDERLFVAANGAVGTYGPSFLLTEGDVRGIELMYARPLEPVADAVRIGDTLHVFAKLDSGEVGYLRGGQEGLRLAHRFTAPPDWAGEPYIKGAPEAVVLPNGQLGVFARGPDDQLVFRVFAHDAEDYGGEGLKEVRLADDSGQSLDIQSHVEVASVFGAPLVWFLDRHQQLRAQICVEPGHAPETDWRCLPVGIAGEPPRARSLRLDAGTIPALVDTAGSVQVYEDGFWRAACGEAPKGVAGRLEVVGDTEAGPLDLLARDGDGNLLHCSRREGRWSSWQVVDVKAGSPPVASRTSAGSVLFWLRANNGHVVEGRCQADQCTVDGDLSNRQIVGAPVLLPGAAGASPQLLVRDTLDHMQAWQGTERAMVGDGVRLRW